MKKINTNSAEVEQVLENLNKGNTVLFEIYCVETKKVNHLVYLNIPVNLEKGFLNQKEPKTGRSFTQQEFLEPIICYVYDSVQNNFSFEIEGISYQPLCFDHRVTSEELIQFETEMKSYISNHTANNN